MGARKRPRPRPRRGARETQRALAALAAARRGGGLETKQLAVGSEADFLSFAQAMAITGVDRWRIGDVVKRAGVPVYRGVTDARRKFIRKADVPRLTGVRLEDPGTPEALAEPMAGPPPPDAGAAPGSPGA